MWESAIMIFDIRGECHAEFCRNFQATAAFAADCAARQASVIVSSARVTRSLGSLHHASCVWVLVLFVFVCWCVLVCVYGALRPFPTWNFWELVGPWSKMEFIGIFSPSTTPVTFFQLGIRLKTCHHVKHSRPPQS